MHTSEKKLDNPVWHSLSETHQRFSIDYRNIKFYHPDYCPFGAFIAADDLERAIDKYALICSHFYIVGEKPSFSSALVLKNELVCDQMVIEKKIEIIPGKPIVKLGEEHANDLLWLVNLVQPGYFKSKTRLLGSYYGIFEEKQLVAVTGERMKMEDFEEVSAVVTHPDHTGKGYAKQLVAHVVNKIISENKNPFLHVAETNTSAIMLYERLGFHLRRKISFWNLILRAETRSNK